SAPALWRFATPHLKAATSRRIPKSGTQPALFLRGVVHLFHRVVHVLMSFLQIIGFLLLLWREQGTDLRHGTVHHRFGFLHRVLMDRDDLRLSLIENRLNLCLLIRRQIQTLGHVFERIAAVMPAAAAGVTLVFGLR